MKQWLLKLYFAPDGGAGSAGAGAAPAGEGSGVQTGVKDTAPAAGETQKRGRRGNPLGNVVYGRQPSNGGQPETANAAGSQGRDAAGTEGTSQEAEARFNELVKGEYKDIYQKNMSEIIRRRTEKANQALEAAQQETAKQQPIIQMLMEKYGVKDVDKLSAAIQEDNSFYEDEAARKGVSVEDLKAFKRTERENIQLRETLEKMKQRQDLERVFAEWRDQAAKVQAKFPGFDFDTECENEEFRKILGSGVGVEAAYKAIHADELLSGAITYTAKTVQQQVADTIRARGQRPVENGMQSSPGMIVKSDVRKLTKGDREEAIRQAARGERIVF